MKIAYLIMTYRDPELLYRMVNALEDSGDFFVYVDKKTDIKPYVELLKNHANVVFISNRRKISWGGWSIVKGNLDMLVAAYNDPKHYDRFVMLSGQDYPLYSNKEIVETFKANKDVEYIMAYNIAKSKSVSDHKKTTKKWFFDCPFKNRFLYRCYRAFMYYAFTVPFTPNKIQVKLGGNWVDPYFGQMLSAFTRDGAELLIDTYKNDKQFNRRMKHVHAPDEIYWHTVIFNSHLKSNTLEKGADHVMTENFGWAPLHYHNYDIKTSVYSKENFDELKNCGYMFCRKVVPGVSDELMDMIDHMRKEKEKQ